MEMSCELKCVVRLRVRVSWLLAGSASGGFTPSAVFPKHIARLPDTLNASYSQ